MKKENLFTSKKNIQKKEKFYFMRFFPPKVNKLYADIKLFLDKLSGFKKIKSLFKKRMGYNLNIESPETYNEKIFWKKIYDRNPLLTITQDKYELRSYLRSVLGKDEAEKILVPVYHVTTQPSKIPFEKLPDKFVVKPNHGSHMHLIVNGNKEALKGHIVELCNKWLKINYGFYHYEWAYRGIKRKIIIEKLLQTKTGELPRDYKLYCFHGQCKLIRVSENRFGKDDVSAYYDTQWNFLPVINPGFKPAKTSFRKPANLQELIKLAEKLSQDFDAVRIDLYDCDNRIYFGEFTHYDGSGLARFEPESFDFELGSYWKLKPNYWKKPKVSFNNNK